MSIVKYNASLNDFVPTTFSSLIDKFFNDSLSRSGGAAYSFVPKVDIHETETAYELQVAAPGVNKEDFKIDVNDSILTISGERKYNKEKKENGFRSIETHFGTFGRSFSLPENVNVNKIEANYNNGILEIIVPKDEKKIAKTSIKVN